METHFALGWIPETSQQARARMLASRRYCVVVESDEPIPLAISLSQYRIAHYEQGQAGTCWVHAGKQVVEVTATALGYKAFSICRRLVGWEGKQLEGGGNPTNGGSPTDAIASMTEGKGVGIAHEDLCPYTDDAGQLGTKPSQGVFDDAKKSHLVSPVVVNGLDQARRLIASKYAVANGIWWPFSWDSNKTFMDSIGQGTYGHALCLMGYAMAGIFDAHDWIQLDNWHGLLYPPLSADLAAKVPGYKPIQADRTSDFWVRADVYQSVCNKGYAEHVSATDLSGIAKKVVRYDFSDAYVF